MFTAIMEFIAILALVAAINLCFKDSQTRRHYKNAIQSNFVDLKYEAKYDSLINRK